MTIAIIKEENEEDLVVSVFGCHRKLRAPAEDTGCELSTNFDSKKTR